MPTLTATETARDSATAGKKWRKLKPFDRKRILIVDDDESIRRLFEMLISSEFPDGVVEVVENGRQAVDLFSDRHHAVVLMDLHMPVLDGRKAFLEIMDVCRERYWEEPSVVFCTGFAPPVAVTRAVSEGRKHCLLSKPITAERLIDAVRGCL